MARAGRIGILVASVALICSAAGLAPVSAFQDGSKANSLFVNLEALAPVVQGNQIPTEVTGGWPLTLRLSGNNDIGIGRATYPPIFPVLGTKGYLVFADPDGCGSWILGPPPVGGGFDWVNLCPGVDETYVEFTPGDGLPALTYDNNPTIKTFNFDSKLNDKLAPIGPQTGPAGSGYGFGRSGRLPGLVILADTGVGLVLDQDFNLMQPRQARNLAGFVSSVAYELNDATRRTSIVAHMAVPRFLFVPLILADRSIGACPGEPWDETWVRVDGGPIRKITPGLNTLESVVERQIVTIRAFVVNRDAPSVLNDLNVDGVVNAKDAMMAGLELLSSEVVIRIRNYYQEIELFGGFYDLDGNGCIGGIVAPAGAGGLTRTPR